MTIEQIRTLFPEYFVVANHKIEIEVVEELSGSFGRWDSYRNKLLIARSANTPDGKIEFQEAQIRNTYWHEWFHCYNFFYNNEADEAMAQTFANFMCEYESTKNK